MVKYMKIENKAIILKYVKILCPNERKPQHTPEYYLSNILDLLTDFVSWSSLKKSASYVGKKENHYKSITRIHRSWSKKGVYQKAYKEIINKNTIDDDCDTLDLLIDATLIINKSGVDNIGYGGECKKKKFTKLTTITDNKGNNISIIANNINLKTIMVPDNNKQNILIDNVVNDNDNTVNDNIVNDNIVNIYNSYQNILNFDINKINTFKTFGIIDNPNNYSIKKVINKPTNKPTNKQNNNVNVQKLIKEYAMSIIKKCNKNDINLMSEVKRFTKKIEKIHTPTNNIKKGAVKS